MKKENAKSYKLLMRDNMEEKIIINKSGINISANSKLSEVHAKDDIKEATKVLKTVKSVKIINHSCNHKSIKTVRSVKVFLCKQPQ